MDYADRSSSIALIEPLSEREVEVLRLMAEDISIQAMAERLYLSPTTIKWYTQQIYSKLEIHEHGQKRRLAVARARTLGLLEPHRTPAGRFSYNLPVQTTPFVGRTTEIHDIIGLLAHPDVRLVTLLGPGGIGKTRLALEIGWRLVSGDAFKRICPDGVYFVPLQPIDTPDHALPAVAEAVGYPFQSDERTPLAQLLDFFREKRLVLIMDNFEHLLESANLISAILEAAPGVQVIATSRERLNLQAETIFSLDGLTFPGRVEDMPDCDAVRLFVLGAQRAQAGFELQPDDWAASVRICGLVQGLPLAILLAATWVETLPIADIAEEIGRSFDFLAAEMRDVPRRQWSIRAVFEPTWQRLSEAEQRVFSCFSVFRGGCRRQAAEAVTGASLPNLQTLMNKAVLSRTPKGRYEIHELLRQYGADRLAAGGEIERTRDAHCAYYAEFMQARQQDLKCGDRQVAVLKELDADFENVRAAWDWAIERRRIDDLNRMEWAVWSFLAIRGRYSEGQTFFQKALDLDEDRGLHGQMMAYYCNLCAEDLRDPRECDEMSDKSLGIAHEIGSPDDLAFALRVRSFLLARLHHDFEQAHRMIDESLALWRTLDDTWGIGAGLMTKGVVARLEGNYSSALVFTEEALKHARVAGNRYRIATGLLNVGADYSSLGKPSQALQCFQECLVVIRELNSPDIMAKAIGNLGVIAQHLGDYDTALRQHEEALALVRELGIPSLVVTFLQDIADILSLTGKVDEAADRLAECRCLLHSLEAEWLEPWIPFLEAALAYRRADYDEALYWAHAALDYTQEHHQAFTESFSWLLIGLVEIKLGHLDDARQHIHTSLPGLRMKDRLMRAVYGLAALEAASGQRERAVEMSALVRSREASEYEFKVYAGDLLAELQASLPPDIYAAAVERGETLDPDAVAAAFLQENGS